MRINFVPVFMEHWVQYLEACVVDQAMDGVERKLGGGERPGSPADGDRLVGRGL